MPYLFTPPLRIETVTMEGTFALRYKRYIATTVFKVDGTWIARESPATEDLEAADQILATAGTPQIVDDVLGAELVAAGPLISDDSHLPATCFAIEA